MAVVHISSGLTSCKGTTTWTKGEISGALPDLSAQFIEQVLPFFLFFFFLIHNCCGQLTIKVALPRLFRAIMTDPDKEVVEMAVRVVSKIVETIGPLAISKHLETVASLLQNLLRRETASQHWDSKELDDMELTNEEQIDLMLFERVFTLLEVMCQVMGKLFQPYAFPLMFLCVPYVQQSEDAVSFAALAIGTMGASIEAMEEGPAEFLPLLTAIAPVCLESEVASPDTTNTTHHQHRHHHQPPTTNHPAAANTLLPAGPRPRPQCCFLRWCFHPLDPRLS